MRLDAFADQTLHDLLDAVAAQQPAPGGGSSAAWSGALGAGLVEMAASFTLARPKYAGVHRRMGDVRREAKTLRRALLELGERDATEGYEPVLAALRLPDKHPDRQSRLEQARSDASEVHLCGDSITGALLAEAAAQAAARLVEINLVGRADDRLSRASEATRRAGVARDEALRVREEVMR
jgi:methenyltetrahydrofolate cyclohydrolase